MDEEIDMSSTLTWDQYKKALKVIKATAELSEAKNFSRDRRICVYRTRGQSLRQIGERYGIAAQRVRDVIMRWKWQADRDPVLPPYADDTPIWRTVLSTRARSTFTYLDYPKPGPETIGEARARLPDIERELLRAPNCGRKTANEIMLALTTVPEGQVLDLPSPRELELMRRLAEARAQLPTAREKKLMQALEESQELERRARASAQRMAVEITRMQATIANMLLEKQAREQKRKGPEGPNVVREGSCVS